MSELNLNECTYCGKAPHVKRDVLFDKTGTVEGNVYAPEVIQMVKVKCCGLSVEYSEAGIEELWNFNNPKEVQEE